jgi:hypothetical protein
MRERVPCARYACAGVVGAEEDRRFFLENARLCLKNGSYQTSHLEQTLSHVCVCVCVCAVCAVCVCVCVCVCV